MKRLIPVLAIALAASPAFAQTVPDAAHKDLWCGVALRLTFTLPAAATEQQKTTLAPYIAAAVALFERGEQGLRDASFPEDQITRLKMEHLQTALAQFKAGGAGDFSAEECRALLPPELATPAADSFASSAPAL
jgi:hypothetical protein